MGKKRVKCANCGMVYDILFDDLTPEHLAIGDCPGCKSNAFDTLPEIWRQYGDSVNSKVEG